MTRLPAEIRPVLDNGMPAVMVTCSADGMPNVTVISQVYYVDETHAALSFQFFSKTIRNVRENPRAYVCVSDIAGQAELGSAARVRTLGDRGPDLRRDGHADRGHCVDDGHVRHLQAEGRRHLSRPLGGAGAVPEVGRFLTHVHSSRDDDDLGETAPTAATRRRTVRDSGRARRRSSRARRAARPPEREFQVLQRVSSDINSTLDLDEIYDVALRTMGELFEFHHAIILLLEPDGETLRVVASRGYENQAIGGRVRIGTGVIGVVAQKRKMLHVEQPRAAARVRRGAAAADDEVGPRRGARRRGARPRPAERGEPDRHPAADAGRADRRVLDREPGAAHVQRARSRARLDRRQSDRERDPQCAALRGAAAQRPTRCRRRTRRSRRASRSGRRRSSASCASPRSS